MEPLKENFSPDLVAHLAAQLQSCLGGFDRRRFETLILADLNELELKERIQLIADHLHEVLPKGLEERYDILLSLLHPQSGTASMQPSDEQGIRGWGVLPLSAVVGQHGQADFELSLSTLKKMTSHFSSEFDVRYFLLADQDSTLAIMKNWVKDPDQHVRRLVSEGTRPRLPWGMRLPRLIEDPTPVLPLLEQLKDDEEEYVRRSVANHLNDIAKDHPELVADLASCWIKGASNNRKKLLRHACRTLLKQGHPQTLELFGFPRPLISLEQIGISSPEVIYGESLNFDVQIKSTAETKQHLMIDYVIYFKKNNGSLAPKVFKWTSTELAPGASLSLTRSHPIRPITTRKYYEGEQALSLRINGLDFGMERFSLCFA